MNRFIPFFDPFKCIHLIWVGLLTGVCCITSPALSQDVLWGLAPNYGPNGAGTAFSLKNTGEDFTIRHAFPNNPNRPEGGLILGNDGYLYGMTPSGGARNRGTIFKISLDGSDFTTIKSFNGDDGAFPEGSLILGKDGYLYGMTQGGGLYWYPDQRDPGHGTIFKISPDGSNHGILYLFTTDVAPRGNLVEGSNGYLYGGEGGGFFKIPSSGGDVIPLTGICCGTQGSLIEGNDGSFYGLTTEGGDNNDGTIFKMSADGTNFTVLKSFKDSTDGTHPQGSLTLRNDGYLYGLSPGMYLLKVTAEDGTTSFLKLYRQ